MSENEPKSSTQLEQAVATAFSSAGYEVLQSVGDHPGEVDWLARPKSGLERPMTYWQVWDTCPAVLDAALLTLEEKRKSKGADRALAVVNGLLPVGHAADLRGRSSNVITFRRLIIELIGFADRVRSQKQRYEAEKGPTQFLSRRGRTSDGEVVDAVEFIKSWIRDSSRDRLVILARPYSGRATLIERVAYELSLEFEKDPENAGFLLLEGSASRTRSAHFEALTPDLSTGKMRTIQGLDISADESNIKSMHPESVLFLLDPTDSDIEIWFQAQSLASKVFEQFYTARREVPNFKLLSNMVPNLSPLLDCMRVSSSQVSKAANEWTAETVAAYIGALLARSFDSTYSLSKKLTNRQLAESLSALEDAAFQQFALGSTTPSHSVMDVSTDKLLDSTLSTWLARGARLYVSANGGEERQFVIERFSNDLVRDYFVAGKVDREMAAGNSTILARYQFPKDYVLLFLAILSPSAVAQATAERSAEIRSEIEGEIERRLQLTLAHQLKRSAGAVRASLRSIQKTIQRKMTPEDAEELSYNIGRIDEEAVFQSALAEQTRLWHEVPEGAVESLALAEHVLSVVEPLREKYVGVRCEVSIERGTLVRANRSGIREILHGLIENAFHAAPLGNIDAPFVRAVAVSEGKSTRLDVIDSGPGIRPEDRDRIFEPYVTTKKGGDQPLGTGMGLVIARRYAQRVGARVEIAADRQETCFFVRFVTGEEKI